MTATLLSIGVAGAMCLIYSVMEYVGAMIDRVPTSQWNCAFPFGLGVGLLTMFEVLRYQ